MAQVINTNSLSLITQNNINKTSLRCRPLSSASLLVCVLTAQKMTPLVRRLLTASPLTLKG